jgi:hypothetical protein
MRQAMSFRAACRQVVVPSIVAAQRQRMHAGAAVHGHDGTAQGRACRRQVLQQLVGNEATDHALQRLDSQW